MAKVLVAAPTSEVKDYIVYNYISLIKNLNHQDYEILIVDNSPVKRTIFDELGVKNSWVNPKGKSLIQVICESQNVIRDYFLANHEYTHLLFIESDLLPSPDCLSLLLMHQKPIVGFPYFIFKWEETKAMAEVAFVGIVKGGSEARILELEEHFLLQDGTLKQLAHIGLGCTLIERWVIEKIKFRYTEGISVHSDSYFYEDCLKLQIPVFSDTSTMVPHFGSNVIV